MSAPTTTTITTPPPVPSPPTSRIEDYILLLGVSLGAAAQFLTTQGTTVMGLSPILIGAILGSIGKGLAGLHDYRSFEDWVLVISSTLGVLGTALTGGNPAWAVYGLVIGQMGKAVLCFIGTNKSNIVENVFLFAFAAVTALGQAFNQPTLLNLGVFLAAFGKALPSLGLSGASTTTVTSAAPSTVTVTK